MTRYLWRVEETNIRKSQFAVEFDIQDKTTVKLTFENFWKAEGPHLNITDCEELGEAIDEVEILKSQVITQLTANNAYGADF